MNDLTPQQAREQLDRAGGTTLGSDRDRTVYAVGTAAFGVVVGAYITLSRLADDTAWETVLTVAYFALLVGLALWQTRAGRTIPRHARSVGRWGLTGTVVLAVAGIMALNWRGNTAEVELPVYLGVGLLIALPMLVAGHRIQHSTR